MYNEKIQVQKAIAEVLKHYAIDFTQVTISPLGNGHINKTYKLTTANTEYVLQQINHEVFPKTVALFSNIEKINGHLLLQKNNSNYPFLVPKQKLTQSRKPYCKVGDNYWRLMDFVADSITIEAVTSTEQAAQVANAFAHFSCALVSFNVNELTIMIDDFHDINARLQQLTTAVKHNSHKRLAHCQTLVDFCFAQSTFVEQVNTISKQLPLHVTHNDTKINNLLFDSTGKVCAVVDLDTCMPGYLMVDFGDMVRTCCSNLAEDDPNITAMTVKTDVLESLLKSYQVAFGDKMTSAESDSLMVGAQLLPFMVGVRFLTDYLKGDAYFQITREKQNLERAINQLHLYKLLYQQNHPNKNNS